MVEQVKNQYGIEVKNCCLSCEHKVIINYCTRKCSLGVQKIKKDSVCDKWQMGKELQGVGKEIKN